MVHSGHIEFYLLSKKLRYLGYNDIKQCERNQAIRKKSDRSGVEIRQMLRFWMSKAWWKRLFEGQTVCVGGDRHC